MLSPVPQNGLFFEELRTLLAKGGMVAFAIDAVGSSCALMLVSMFLAATTTHSVRSSAFVLAMSKFMAFETTHRKRNVRSYRYRKEPAIKLVGGLGQSKVRTIVLVGILTSPFRTWMRRAGMTSGNSSTNSSSVQSLKSLCLMTPLEVLRLLCGPIVTGMSKNDMTFSSLRSCSLLRSSTMRSPLRCLVTPWGRPES